MYTISYNSEDPGTQVHGALHLTVHSHGKESACAHSAAPCAGGRPCARQAASVWRLAGAKR